MFNICRFLVFIVKTVSVMEVYRGMYIAFNYRYVWTSTM